MTEEPTPEGRVIEPKSQEGEISVFVVAAILLRARWRIVRWALIGAFFAGLTVISKPVLYSASASFIPEGHDASRSAFAGLAGQLGVSIPTAGNAAVSPDFYSMLLKSRVILEPVVRETFTVPELGGRRVAFLDLFEISGPNVAVRAERGVAALKGMIFPSIDSKTGVVTLTVRTPWRSVSLAIASALIEGVNEYNSRVRQGQAATERQFVQGRLDVARTDLRNAEDRLERFLRTNREFGGSPELMFERDRLQRDVLLRQQIFSSLTQAFEEARIREVRDTPVVTVFEAPSAPSAPDPRGRVRRVFLGTLLGALIGLLFAFSSGMLAIRQRQGDPEAEEFLRSLRETKNNVLRWTRRLAGRSTSRA